MSVSQGWAWSNTSGPHDLAQRGPLFYGGSKTKCRPQEPAALPDLLMGFLRVSRFLQQGSPVVGVLSSWPPVPQPFPDHPRGPPRDGVLPSLAPPPPLAPLACSWRLLSRMRLGLEDLVEEEREDGEGKASSSVHCGCCRLSVLLSVCPLASSEGLVLCSSSAAAAQPLPGTGGMGVHPSAPRLPPLFAPSLSLSPTQIHPDTQILE